MYLSDPDKDGFAYRWSVTVSNDGQHPGQVSDLIVYNGICQNVVKNENTSSVQLKDNFCFINGICVPEGITNSSDLCQICQITDQMSRFQWSRNPGIGDCAEKQTTTPTLVLVNKTSLPPKFEIQKPSVNVSLVDKLSPVFNINVQSLEFVCDFTLLSEDVLYQVIWYIDGKEINETKIANGTDVDNLVLEERTGQLEKLGVHVTCAVRALPTNGVPGKLSPRSDPFYAGIATTPSVTLYRDKVTAFIVVKPTVPIGCPALYQDGCEVVVELILPETYKCRGSVGAILPVGAQTCGKHIRHDEWDQEHKIYIAWLDDQTYNGHPDSYRVNLRTAVNNYNPIWSNVALDDVNVVMDDNTRIWKGKECHAICDPHMKTFDGRNYENQNDGTFIFYGNDDPSRKVEVQMKVTPCNPPAHVFCVCAIAVRAGGDVFVIDRCPGIYRNIFEFRSCEDHILDVRKINENMYKIYLPSGTYLSAYLRHYTGKDVMDLHMYPSAADTFHTRGLCGTLNGRTDDDFTKSDGQITTDNNIFATSWRVTEKDDNLITMSADALEKLPSWNVTENTQFCTCNGPSRNISCTRSAIATCVREDETPVIKQNKCKIRRSRSLRPISLMPNTTQPTMTGPPKQIWNKTTATDYCDKFLKESSSFNACVKQIPATDPDSAMDTCVLDIMATQTTMWASSARESLKSVCMKELKQNTTYHEDESGDKRSIAQQIKEITCPNECNGHGQCSNGTCVCDTDFGAADCSINIRQPPRMYGVNLDTNGTCDLNTCQTAIVEGETFIDNFNLTCHNTLYQIHRDGTEMLIMKWKSHAQFNTLVEVFCPFPNVLSDPDKDGFAYRWSVTVSNDGHHTGQVSDLIVYNGICQNVVKNEDTSSVQLKDNFCFINGICVPEGITNSSDLCQICQITDQMSRFQWSRNPGIGDCAEKQTTTPTLVLVNKTSLPPKFEIQKPSVNVSLVDKLSPVFNINVQSLEFVCDFTLLSEDVLYQVIWYIDGKEINETKIANGTEVDNLVLEERTGQLEKLGVHVTCAVRALPTNGLPGKLSPRSDPFYAGIATTPSVTLYRDKATAFIVVKPTVPIGCPALYQDGCEVVVELILPETYKCRGSVGAILPVGAQTCGKHIRHDEWDQEHKIYIAWLDDQTYNGHPDSYRVNLRTAVNNYNPIWSNVALDDVNVVMDDNTRIWKGKECHAICDPHMKTFDGRNYENQNDGTFIFFENDDPSRKVEVQMKVTRCTLRLTCFVCAPLQYGQVETSSS
ncbi:von Willebrand factor D and EGF domain-containing protein-like [Pecten maximus]|uniref:von Willebrand factor D and EGF domain-containing protein-like n=1 Tax=Pecten maximus TaxID=6579 RepID=UPI001457FCB0|nr:von Willebrand factor D and EGF domain-containing protein-like [Pecten maximus]